jgi:hypothetical protein
MVYEAAISIKENSDKEVLLIEKDKKRRIRSSGGISKFFLYKAGYRSSIHLHFRNGVLILDT